MTQPLTADVCAAAIVAAARIYSVDPLHALSVKRGGPSQCLVPAAVAIATQTGIHRRRAARIIGLHPNTNALAPAITTSEQLGFAVAAALVAIQTTARSA